MLRVTALIDSPDIIDNYCLVNSYVIKYLSYINRYSYFHKLLPLLMTGLSDELPDIQRLAKELMSKVHNLYSNIKKFNPSMN